MEKIDNFENNVNWKRMYDIMSLKYETLGNENEELQVALNRIKDTEARKGKESILRGLLGTSDDLQRLKSALDESADISIVRDAVSLIVKNINNFLSRESVSRVNAEPGVEFDPVIHEAIFTVRNIDLKDNTIFEVVQDGYIMDNTLLRPARVIVVSNN